MNHYFTKTTEPQVEFLRSTKKEKSKYAPLKFHIISGVKYYIIPGTKYYKEPRNDGWSNIKKRNKR